MLRYALAKRMAPAMVPDDAQQKMEISASVAGALANGSDLSGVPAKNVVSIKRDIAS
jgi:hypothetical protein